MISRRSNEGGDTEKIDYEVIVSQDRKSRKSSRSLTSISLQGVDEVDPNNHLQLKLGYESRELLLSLRYFILRSQAKSNCSFRSKLKMIQSNLVQINNSRNQRNLPPLDISFLEHSHYIYCLVGNSDLTQEQQHRLNLRKKAFSDQDYPTEEVYLFILKFLKFISSLMAKWHIFDLTHYGFQYKGRSLTVNLLDMNRINKQCIAADIFWYSFAIDHKPFHNKANKILKSYARLLQHTINRVFSFFANGEIGDESTFECLDFTIIPKWKCIFNKRTQGPIQALYNHVKSVEVAYRTFEKQLIEEFLKLV